MTTVLGTLAGAYGLVSVTSPLLQLQRMRRSRSSADVSLGSLGIGVGGALIWLCYGLALANLALILVDLGCLITGLATLTVAWRLRRAAAPATFAVLPPVLPQSAAAPAIAAGRLIA